MAYQALYRVWRSQRFDDVVGQKAITQTLKMQSIKTRSRMPIYLRVLEEPGKQVQRKFLPKPSIVRTRSTVSLAMSAICVAQSQQGRKKT